MAKKNTGTSKERFSRWYEAHGEEFNAERRKKYRKSKSYRTRVRSYAKRTRRKRREKNPMGFFLVGNNRIFWHTPECRAYYTTSVIARESGLTYSVFRTLQQADDSIIPGPVKIHPRGKGWALYTAAQVVAVQKARDKWGWDKEHFEAIGAFLLERWHDEDDDQEGEFEERTTADEYCTPEDREAFYRKRQRDIERSRRTHRSDTYEYYFERKNRENDSDGGDV